jgi:hypothetical protein
MFINQIDEIINNVIDSMYNTKIDVEKKIDDLIDKKILKNIKNLLDNRYSSYILNIIEKLILYFIILLSGVDKKDFTKYIMNLSTISPKKLDSETISKIIKLYNLYIDIKLSKNKDLIIDIDIDLSLLNLKNKEGIFNLLKILIVKYVYQDEYRHSILELIEHKELENTEFKYIEIIDSKDEEIDYNNLEMLFDTNEKKYSEIFYQMIIDYENDVFEENVSIEQKINYLFKKKILIPITDEFIRYNKYNEKFDNQNIKLDKIRTVVSNINIVTDIYSKKNPDYGKYFYQSLINRKAVLYNSIEEINSINKLLNIGLTAMRSNEYFHDLLIYKQYPYINFNNFKNYGFSFLSSESINSIRYSNFEFKKINLNNFLETRIISSDSRVNIIGVALPKYSIFNKSTIIQCTKVKNTYNLDNIQKKSYKYVIKKIKEMLLNNVDNKIIIYWIFNKNKDIFTTDTYNDINELSFEDFYRYMISTFYDVIIDITYQKIINSIEKCKTLHSCHYISNNIQNKLINLSNNSKYNFNLQKVFIDTTKKKKEIKYDTNEDIIPGINTELIKLPKYINNNNKLINIRVTNNNDDNDNDDEYLNDHAICQHNISWDKLYIYKKKDPNYFNQLLFEFKKQYITINLEGDFVCKSCYQQVNIKSYAFDWISDTEKGIGLSFTLETQLKDLQEYEKYNIIISQLDKNIEKIAASVHLPVYIGNIPQIKLRRQEIIKNIIDFINIQYKTLRIIDSIDRKKRLDKVVNLYGLNKDYTQFFIFELQNDIFLYSSKETDKFKRNKKNNIFIYAIMFLINEISLNQVMFFIKDKYINIEIFKKNYKSLFNNLFIYVNNSKELKPIYDYPLLCYILYIFAGVLIRYNLWYHPDSTVSLKNNTSIKGFNLKIYSSIIHTYIDLLNSILEVNTFKEKSYLYEIYATKFYIQLNKVFSCNKILSNINITNIVEKKKNQNIIITPITGQILLDNVFFGYYKYYLKSAFKNILVPSNNKTKLNDIQKYFENWNNDLLYDYYEYYNLDGTKRLLNDIKEENITKKKLLNMLQNIIIKRKTLCSIIEQQNIEYNNNINNTLLKHKQYNSKLNKDFNNNNNTLNLIQNLEKIVNIDLTKNQYIIIHDICGNKFKNPIIINEGDKRIEFKRNDTRYGSNIYIYQDNNIFYIYNAITLNLIAYKNNLNKIINVNLPLYLKINYSFKHHLLLLGYEKLNYNIKDVNKNKLINSIIRNRIINLKNILINIQKILYQIYNKYDNINTNIIAKIYMNKFKNINITLDTSEINKIINNIFFTSIDPKINVQDDNDNIYINNLKIIQNGDTIILNFMCNEIIKLLDANNSDKYTLTNLGFIIIDIIKKEYNNYMKRNNSLNNIEVRKFIETNESRLIFSDKDTIEDFIDDNNNNENENENDNVNEDNEHGFDVDDNIDIDVDEKESLFTI